MFHVTIQRPLRWNITTQIILLSLLDSLTGFPCWPAPRGLSAEEPPQREAAEAPRDWPVIITKLRQQTTSMPANTTIRKQLAIAYNNYAISLSEQGNLEEAIKELKEALQLDAANLQFQHNLARLYLRVAADAYRAHRSEATKEAIDQALAISPREAQAYALLGELEYDRQRLKEARAAWEEALAINPDLEAVHERLKQLNQELPVESRFERLSQAYFDLRYTGELNHPAGFDIRDALLEARRIVGADFQIWPTHKLVVLLYSAEQFRQLRQDTPDWVSGQYDGKIRVPLPGKALNREAVLHTLTHEYTHAIVHEAVGNRVPTWLNEGLAEYEAYKHQQPPWPLLRKAQAEDRLISFEQLDAHFSYELSAEEVALAYQQSHSLVCYLVERYGFWRIRRLLKALREGTALETIWNTEFHIKPARLESEWRTWLANTLKK